MTGSESLIFGRPIRIQTLDPSLTKYVKFYFKWAIISVLCSLNSYVPLFRIRDPGAETGFRPSEIKKTGSGKIKIQILPVEKISLLLSDRAVCTINFFICLNCFSSGSSGLSSKVVVSTIVSNPAQEVPGTFISLWKLFHWWLVPFYWFHFINVTQHHHTHDRT